MKAREGSRRFSDSKKRLAPGEILRKMSWRRGVVCEKLSRRRQEFGKKLLGVQRVNVCCIMLPLTDQVFRICGMLLWRYDEGLLILT